MRPDEMVLDPWSFISDDPQVRESSERQPIVPPPSEPAVGPTIPPVRTIVLDRTPTPVRPVGEREAVRRPESAAGPERLS